MVSTIYHFNNFSLRFGKVTAKVIYIWDFPCGNICYKWLNTLIAIKLFRFYFLSNLFQVAIIEKCAYSNYTESQYFRSVVFFFCYW